MEAKWYRAAQEMPPQESSLILETPQQYFFCFVADECFNIKTLFIINAPCGVRRTDNDHTMFYQSISEISSDVAKPINNHTAPGYGEF